MPAEPAALSLPRVRPGLARGVEVPVALALLVAASPMLLVAALAVVATSRGPAFFRQQRVGRAGRPFMLVKLRSMTVGGAGSSLTGSGDRRVTPIGRWLRRTKLDEVPQLWNVLQGDMSLVGPRPEVPRYADLSDPRWARVLEARPGITDPLTLKLRDEEALMPAAEDERERFYVGTLLPLKLQGYLEYLGRRSWRSDLAVLLATAAALARPGRGPTRDEILRSGRL